MRVAWANKATPCGLRDVVTLQCFCEKSENNNVMVFWLVPFSLSTSMLSLSSSSSPGSLASSRGSLATSSQDSSTSASFTDLYYEHLEQLEQLDSEYQNKLDLLLEGATGFRPSGCITTIHENEVAKTQKADTTSRMQALRSLSGTPKSMTSLSPRSSLSSPSPPCSPLVIDPLLTGDAFSSHMDFDDAEISANLSELTLNTGNGNCRLEEPRTGDKHLGQGMVRKDLHALHAFIFNVIHKALRSKCFRSCHLVSFMLRNVFNSVFCLVWEGGLVFQFVHKNMI